MAFARQWVEPGHRHRAEEQQRTEGADQNADGQQRRRRLLEEGRAFGRRLVADPAQHLQGNKNRQCAGHLADEVLDAIVNAFLATARAQLVPFDHIREKRIRQHVRGRDRDTCKYGQYQDIGDLSRLDGEDQQLHYRPEGHTNNIGRMFVEALGHPDPEGQHQYRCDQEQRKNSRFHRQAKRFVKQVSA